ncbi:MAG: DNA adenine methylase [Bacteroidia bacterium]|nr:MAG: DNA adenine methylase [Bacteroidia bacterium]PIE86535.1 MAG: DNA adenine methylase [Bacteroidia bacterium]
MQLTVKYKQKQIKSPLNYIGGKFRLLSQILPLFPNKIDNFIDLFAGGCNVGINVDAEKIFFNDNLTFLIEMYQMFQDTELNQIINHIENRITEFDLSQTNEQAYKAMRNLYNQEKNPLDLFVLIAYSFNHQIRFNNSHEFNNPFGRNRSSFNAKMKQNLKKFIIKIKEQKCYFSNLCFTDFDFSSFNENDFVYCDPPYLITTGTYNDGKRGFKGWSITEEKQLLSLLDELNSRNIKFALSNVIEHKGKSNDILKDWINSNDYNVNYLNFNYSNSNYQTIMRDKKATVEVLVTNYHPPKQSQLSLFD